MSTNGRSSSFSWLILLLVVAIPLSFLANPDWLSKLTYAVEVGQARFSQEQVETATDLSQAFQHVARSMKPSVVSISADRQVAARESEGRRFRSPIPDEFRRFFDDDQFERFFEFQAPEHGLRRQGRGSGVIVSNDGYILTNNHLVREADEVMVTLSDNRGFRAEIVGTDASTDLAILKIDAGHLEPAKLGDSRAVEVGEWVLAVGSPFGLDQTVTAGIISATSRANVGITDYEDFLQTDAAINPGNSGGPLVNLRGEVVGINTAIASRSGGYMGVGFAIPSDIARHVMDSIIAEGHVTRGWLGAMIQDLDSDLAESFGYDSTDGVLIGDLVPDSPGKNAGLQSGDIVTKYNGETMRTANELRHAVARTKPDEEVEFEIFREGESLTVTVRIGELDQDKSPLETGTPEDTAVDLGMTVQTLTPERNAELGLPENAKGVVVTEVEPDSLAARARISPQDVIVSVGGKLIESVSDFQEAMADEDPQQGIRLQVMRDGFRRYVFIRSR